MARTPGPDDAPRISPRVRGGHPCTPLAIPKVRASGSVYPDVYPARGVVAGEGLRGGAGKGPRRQGIAAACGGLFGDSKMEAWWDILSFSRLYPLRVAHHSVLKRVPKLSHTHVGHT